MPIELAKTSRFIQEAQRKSETIVILFQGIADPERWCGTQQTDFLRSRQMSEGVRQVYPVEFIDYSTRARPTRYTKQALNLCAFVPLPLWIWVGTLSLLQNKNLFQILAKHSAQPQKFKSFNQFYSFRFQGDILPHSTRHIYSIDRCLRRRCPYATW